MTSSQTNENETFGLQIYNELRSRGHFHVLTNHFNYDGLQRLKQASREEVVKMMVAYGYATVQASKTQSAKEIADLLTQAAATQAHGAPMMMMFLGM